MRSIELGEADPAGRLGRPVGVLPFHHHPAAVAIMKRGKKWPLNGLLHLNRDLAAAASAEGIPDHHLRFEQRHRSYSMDGGGGGDENGYQEGTERTGQASKSSISMHGYPVKLQSHGLYCGSLQCIMLHRHLLLARRRDATTVIMKP